MGRRGPKRGPLARKALELRLKGLTYAAIGRELGISRQRVQQMTSPPARVRDMVVERARGRCEGCDAPVGRSGQVHHRRVKGDEPDDYNDTGNLMLACRSCHQTLHGEWHPASYPTSCRIRNCIHHPKDGDRTIERSIRELEWTVEAAAARLDVTAETVRRWLRNGDLRGIRIGGTKAGWRIPESEVGAFMDRARKEGSTDA